MSHVGELLAATMDAVSAAKDVDALPRLAEIVRSPEQINVAREALCTAEEISSGQTEVGKAS